MTREETMRVIAKGVNPDSICPLIEDMAKQAAYGFELAREYAFEHDEDEIILDLMMRLYIDDKYMEAVDMLTITIALIGADQMYTKMALVAAAGRDDKSQGGLQIQHTLQCGGLHRHTTTQVALPHPAKRTGPLPKGWPSAAR